jgi:RHS repeat-associated protein
VQSNSTPAQSDRYLKAGSQWDSALQQWVNGARVENGDGRWDQEDPTEFEPGDPNLYRYVGNDPTNETDPSGLEPPKDKKPDPKPGSPEYDATSTSLATVLNGEFIERATRDDAGGRRITRKLTDYYGLKLTTDPGVVKAEKESKLNGYWYFEADQAKTKVSFAFVGNVRFKGDFRNVTNAGFIQTVERSGTITKKDGTKAVMPSYIIEGFEARDGKAVEIDSHYFESGTYELAFGSGDTVTLKCDFTVGIGRYMDQAPKGFKIYYEEPTKWTKEEYEKIKWLGPTITYTVEITVKDDGSWTWKDTGASINTSGKLNSANPPKR